MNSNFGPLGIILVSAFVLYFVYDIVKVLKKAYVSDMTRDEFGALVINLVTSFLALLIVLSITTYLRVKNELNSTIYIVLVACLTPLMKGHTESISLLLKTKSEAPDNQVKPPSE